MVDGFQTAVHLNPPTNPISYKAKWHILWPHFLGLAKPKVQLYNHTIYACNEV